MRVFIASTSDDLAEFRKAATDAILSVNAVPVRMEDFGTSSRSIIDECIRRVRSADVFLLLIAYRRGWVPELEKGGDGHRSIVAYELEAAQKLGIPILVMMAKDSWPGNLWEKSQEGRDWIDEFRRSLNWCAMFFSHEEPHDRLREVLPRFHAQVRQVLVQHLVEQVTPTNGTGAPSETEQLLRAHIKPIEDQLTHLLAQPRSRWNQVLAALVLILVTVDQGWSVRTTALGCNTSADELVVEQDERKEAADELEAQVPAGPVPRGPTQLLKTGQAI